MDTAERMLTPLVWGDTKAILGLLVDGLSPGDTALTHTRLLNIAWALPGYPSIGHTHIIWPPLRPRFRVLSCVSVNVWFLADSQFAL
jgi:hypothetical protein